MKVTRNLLMSLVASLALAVVTPVLAQEATSPDADAASRDQFRQLDQDVQSLKKEVLDLNRDLFLLEEELLFPANSQVAFFISMDVGEYFKLDSVSLKIDGKEVANYLYTDREAGSLLRGGVHRVHMANLKAGDHELVAIHQGIPARCDDEFLERHRRQVCRARDHRQGQETAAGICHQGMGVIIGHSPRHRRKFFSAPGIPGAGGDGARGQG
jgi:hypothetical protein